MMYTPKSEPHNAVVFTVHDHFEPQQLVGAYLARYPQSYDFTLGFEGGYVNDPDDPGGCTNKGITIGTLRAWRNDPDVTCDDVAALTDLEAGLIYAQNYWSPVWGNKLPIGLNTQVWDWGVNSGPTRSVKYLQLMIDSPQDGLMGPNTLSAVLEYVKLYGVEAAIREYQSLRQGYYESLDTFWKYGDGWTRRNEECAALGITLSQQDPLELPDIPDPTLPPEDGELADRVTRLEQWAGSIPPFS